MPPTQSLDLAAKEKELETFRSALQKARDGFALDRTQYRGMFGIVSNSVFLNSKKNRDNLKDAATTKSATQVGIIKEAATTLQGLIRELSPNATLEKQLDNIAKQEDAVQSAANKKWDAPILIKACHILRTELDKQTSPTPEHAALSNKLKALQTELTVVHDERESKKGHGIVKANNVPDAVKKMHATKRTLQIVGLAASIIGIGTTIAGVFFPPLIPVGMAMAATGAACGAGLIAEKAAKNRWRHSEYGIELTTEQVKSGAKTVGGAALNVGINVAFVGTARGLTQLVTTAAPTVPHLAKLPNAVINAIQIGRTVKSNVETAKPLVETAVTKASEKATLIVATITTEQPNYPAPAAPVEPDSTIPKEPAPQPIAKKPHFEGIQDSKTRTAEMMAAQPFQEAPPPKQTTYPFSQLTISAGQAAAKQAPQPVDNQSAAEKAPSQSTTHPHHSETVKKTGNAAAVAIAKAPTVTAELIAKNHTDAVTAKSP